MPIVGVNHRLPKLNISKIMVHRYTTYENINPFSINYMINFSLKFNNTIRIKVETFVCVYFSAGAMKTIKNCLMKKNTCVMSIIMIYENNGEIPKRLYRVLCYVVYSLIYNYVCIEYLSCQS